MKNFLLALDSKVEGLLKVIGRLGDERSVAVYVVGGFVRDLILKKQNLDIDIVLEGDALQFAQDFSRLKNCSLKIFKQFGTAAVFFSNGLRVDFATARSEVYPRPGALPVVSAGTIREDLFRRDFRINAMAIRLNRQSFGELVDEFSGMKDLKEKKISVLHLKSFIDDPTRILRAVRFEQRLNFKIESKTLKILKSAISNKVFKTVTPERYFEEFKKLLLEPSVWKPLVRLSKLGGLDFLDFSLTDMRALIELLKKIEKNRLRKKISEQKPIWLMNFQALSETVSGKNLALRLKRFAINKETQNIILESQGSAHLFKHLKKVNLKPSGIYKILSPLSPETTEFLLLKTDSSAIRRKIRKYLLIYSRVQLEITGHDLLKLGVPRGEKIGEILNKILYDKLDGLIKTKQEELNLALKLMLV